MSKTAEARALYRAFVRESSKFPNYNVREYIRRRAKEAFSATPEASKAEELMQTARREYEVVKRQAVVFNLYARKQKNVMELQSAK
ncbi:hypothetical protein Ndes2526B_g06445 [Nannochloris sp. 'desiccata']